MNTNLSWIGAWRGVHPPGDCAARARTANGGSSAASHPGIVEFAFATALCASLIVGGRPTWSSRPFPYQGVAARVQEQIAEQMRAKKLPMVDDLRDSPITRIRPALVVVPRSTASIWWSS